MSRLAVTFTQDVGDKISIVPIGDQGFMISLGRRNAEGGLFLDLPHAQAAVLLSKLTRAFMEMDAPCPALDEGVTTAGDAGMGVLASLRAGLLARGAELTPPAPVASDDFGVRETEHQHIAGMLQSLADGVDPDTLRQQLGYQPLGDASGRSRPTIAEVEAYVGRFDHGGNVVDLRSRRP